MFAWDSIFEIMEVRDNDFWGLGEHIGGTDIEPHIQSYFMPRFILSGRKDSPAINYPFIYSCNLTEHGIELHSLPHPQIGCDISYQDVKWMEMFVIRRV